MLTLSHFQNLQRTFYKRVTSNLNRSPVSFDYVTLTQRGGVADFVGESIKQSVSNVEFHAFYQRNISDKTREKYGIANDVTALIYISPIEYKRKMGTYVPDSKLMVNKANLRVNFLGGYYSVNQIVVHEPIESGGVQYCFGIELRLVNAVKQNVVT